VLTARSVPSRDPKITFPGGSGCGSKPRITPGVPATGVELTMMIAPVAGSRPSSPFAVPTNTRPPPSTGADIPSAPTAVRHRGAGVAARQVAGATTSVAAIMRKPIM
jgi:hypothetical protein